MNPKLTIERPPTKSLESKQSRSPTYHLTQQQREQVQNESLETASPESTIILIREARMQFVDCTLDNALSQLRQLTSHMVPNSTTNIALSSLGSPHGAQFDLKETAHMVATRQAMLVNCFFQAWSSDTHCVQKMPSEIVNHIIITSS